MFESYFDSDAQKQELLLGCLPKEANIDKKRAYDKYDLELYYVTDSSQVERYICSRTRSMPDKCVIVCSDKAFEATEKVIRKSSDDNNVQNLIKFNGLGFESLMLKDILDTLKLKALISKEEHQDFLACWQLYNKHRIWGLTLEARFFYSQEGNSEAYIQTRNRYLAASKSCLYRFMKQGGWKNKETLHQQYAFLNLAYEGNLYCVRCGGTMIYTVGSLVGMCRSLMKDQQEENWRKSFGLLLAQIYDDLLLDFNKALENYLVCCDDYNAYAFYRKGIIFQEQAGDYEKALKYYETSVRIYPEYYRAWYRIGRCYMQQNRYREALEVFRNIKRILEPRLDENVLRPMEIEYLFKAQNQCAYICNKALGNLGQAVVENQIAAKVWKRIDKSIFFEQIGYEKRKKKLWETTKKALCVNKIYVEILKLAEKLKDDQLKKNTQADIAQCLAGGCNE